MTQPMRAMRAVPLDELPRLLEGALDVRVGAGYVRPWRLPLADFDLHHPMLRFVAAAPAGVRLRLSTDSHSVALEVAHVGPDDGPLASPPAYDLVFGTDVLTTYLADPSSATSTVTFADLPGDGSPLEVWLPHNVGVRLVGLAVDDGATVEPVEDPRPRWVTYGSSITHCLEVARPTDTWPSIAARALDWHLTCLGFAGMAHLDPLVARAMAARPADRFTLKVGINVHNMASLRERTFAPMVHGFLATLRDRHPTTPITLISPVLSPEREHDALTHRTLLDGTATDLAGDLTLTQMRETLESVVEQWRARGDDALDYLDGRELFGNGDGDLDHLPDGLHPDPEGYRRIGTRFAARFASR